MALDLPSYLLGKSKGGSGGDLSEYFTDNMASIASSGSITDAGWYNAIKTFPELTIAGTSAGGLMAGFPGDLPFLNTSNIATFRNFAYMSKTTSIPQYDMSAASDFVNAFNGCENLQNVPVLNIKKGNMQSMFAGCRNLTDTSLDNILQMCINATSYTGTKTLVRLGFASADYPASRIQALPHYQDFIDANWKIGY